MAPPTPSLLDWGQIIQRIFDEPNGQIRTTATLTVPGGGIQVIINHEEDSVRLGDGTNFFTSTQVIGKNGLDVNVINNGVASTPYIYNLNVPLANTEVLFSVPNNTTLLIIRSRTGSLKISYTSGGPFLSVSTRGVYTVENLNTENVTVYFESSVSNDVIEIHGWTP